MHFFREKMSNNDIVLTVSKTGLCGVRTPHLPLTLPYIYSCPLQLYNVIGVEEITVIVYSALYLYIYTTTSYEYITWHEGETVVTAA